MEIGAARTVLAEHWTTHMPLLTELSRSLISRKIARFVLLCTMDDIGTEDDWAPAQRDFILSGVPKRMGVSTETGEEPCAG